MTKRPTKRTVWGPVLGRAQFSAIKDKLTAKNVDEDPASCKRWISRKEI